MPPVTAWAGGIPGKERKRRKGLLKQTGKLRIYITIVCICFLQGLQFGPSPVLAQIQEHYPQIPTSLVQMLITAPSLVGMVFALVCGVLVTKISKKRLLLAAAAVAFITGMVPLLADNFWLLIGMRTLYGYSLGLATALNTAVVAEWFTGDERVVAMGVQSASVGAGIAVVTAGAGRLGAIDFTNSYFINIIGAISFILILICLPDTGASKPEGDNQVRLNSRVFQVAFLGFLEFLFLISYTTNIAMHLQGDLAGNSSAAGNLTSLFSIAQIIIGLLLGFLTKITKKLTLSMAMLSFAAGALLLVLFPGNFVLLGLGSLLCGFSQGAFVPTAMVEVSNAVPPVAAAMASGVLTCATCIGQVISPLFLNTVAGAVLGSATTTHVFMIDVVGMLVSAVLAAVIMLRQRQN